jgi:hypothetical protein
MKNLYLNNENDLVLKNFNLRVTETYTEWLSQRIENEFKFFAGEWFADQTRGIDYYGKILIKRVDIDQVSALFLEVLKNIQGVEEVLSFSANYIGESRTYQFDFVIRSDEGTNIESSFTV